MKMMRTPVEEATLPFDPRSPGVYRTPVSQSSNGVEESPYNTPMGKGGNARNKENFVRKKAGTSKALKFDNC